MAVFPKAALFSQLYRAGLQVAWIINIPATILVILIASMRIPALLRELPFLSFLLSPKAQLPIEIGKVVSSKTGISIPEPLHISTIMAGLQQLWRR